jgi:hypothetical protein
MGIENIVGNLFGNRVTFGTSLELQDGNINIQERLFPNRISLMGVCSNSARDADNPDEYLIPNNQPVPIQSLRDLVFLRNDDPEKTASEILLSYYDASSGGGNTFEVTILDRAVVQLGGDVSVSDTVIPVSTVFTNKVTRMLNTQAHPLGATNTSGFEQAGSPYYVGGSLTYTPASGSVTVVAQTDMAAGDYVSFAHSDGRVVGFWFQVGGSDPVPAALQAAVTAGAVGSAAIEVDITGATTADEVRDALGAAVQAYTDLPIAAVEGGAGEVDLISLEPGLDGNEWTVDDVIADAGSASAGMAGGSAVNSSNALTFYIDTNDNDTWKTLLDAAGMAVLLDTPVAGAGILRDSASEVDILGGTLSNGNVTDAVQRLTFSAPGVAAPSTEGAITGAVTDLTNAAWVDTGTTRYVIGGHDGTNPSDVIGSIDGAYVVTLEDNLAQATSELGAYHDASNNKIFIFGGLTIDGPTPRTYEYDVLADEIEGEVGQMTQAKYAFAYAVVGNAVYAFGGSLLIGETTRIERFDPETKTWSARTNLIQASTGGTAVTANLRIYYADADQGGKYNVGVGNLSDPAVGFQDPATLNSDPLHIQLEWEIMRVTAYTTVRSRGRDTDAFVVQRGQRGSTAVAHVDFADITHDPEVLYDQMSTGLEAMVQSSTADFVVAPWRATADCPYLEQSKNFAFLVGLYASAKTNYDRMVMATLGVHPPNENPRVEYTRAQEKVWVDHLNNYDRLNYEGLQTWKVGDGVTDDNNDRKPDHYALWFTRDAQIPSGAPPMESGEVVKDTNDRPIDLGKHLVIVTTYGFATAREYRNKFPSASRGYLRSCHPQFAGALSTLSPAVGSTGIQARGVVPVRVVTLLEENDLIRNRYVLAVQRTNGIRWSNGLTFGYNVSDTSRTDWTFASSMRKVAALTRAVRKVIDLYVGKNTDRESQTAMDQDISKLIQDFVNEGIVGARTVHNIEVDPDEGILGYARVHLSVHIPGELMRIDMVAALSN